MLILLTNDDGVYSPGLVALQHQLRRLGEVCLVAPAAEQSGVGHSITFMLPLIAKEVFDGSNRRGWAVEGSPADCVKLGIFEFCGRQPDLVVSGINSGLNAGINVLYSGTVAAAIEGAFFGVTSIAVSLEYAEPVDHDRAAEIAVHLVQKLVQQKGPRPQLFNVNIPKAALRGTPRTQVVPMGLQHYGREYEKRVDPRGRAYYWAMGDFPPIDEPAHDTDLTALARGHITITPLDFDLTRHDQLSAMRDWNLAVPPSGPRDAHAERSR